jgi:hypothetical protein
MKRALGAALLALPLAAADAASLRDLSFMSGCWTTAREAAEVTRECFTAPHAGLLQGSSQTVKDGKTVFWEFAVIEQKGDVITYTPYLKGKSSVSFTATDIGDGRVVFENPAHDFPTRIIYRRPALGQLEARVEGPKPDHHNNKIWLMNQQ